MERVQDVLSEESSVDRVHGLRELSEGQQRARADLLSYIGDMVEELQLMCKPTGCATLVGLLALAHAEATLQQQDYRQRRTG